MRHIVDREAALLDVLQSILPDSSKTSLRKMLESGRIRVGSEIEKKGNRALRKGEIVDVAPRTFQQFLDPRLSILFEDEYLIVVVKSCGVLTVASPGEKEETAQAFLNTYLGARHAEGRIHVVHRLDRDASGVLVFAKDFGTRELLKEKFAAHDIDRIYVAIVEGRLRPPAGTIRSYLAEDQALKVRSVSERKGKLAVTHYRTVVSGPSHSELEVTLETGRRNQIRVHLSEAGHPIAGDAMYGGATDPLDRLGLHARRLGFVHPHTGRKLEFEAPVPVAFTAFIESWARVDS